jgi:hypothetical protein
MSVVVGVTLDALDVDPRRPLDDPSMGVVHPGVASDVSLSY